MTKDEIRENLQISITDDIRKALNGKIKQFDFFSGIPTDI